MAQDPSTERIMQAVVSVRRSSLARWMTTHYAEFAKTLEVAGRPNWAAVAEAFATEGFRDLKGRKPTAGGVRQTWWKVRKAMAAKQAAKAIPAKQGGPLPAPTTTANPTTRGTSHDGRIGRRTFDIDPRPSTNDRARLIGGEDGPA